MNQGIDGKLNGAGRAVRGEDRALDDLIAEMIVSSEAAATPLWHRRPWRLRSKVAIGALAGALVLGTASASAATQPWLWTKEYVHADTASTITLPSGKSCEIRAIITPASPSAPPTVAAIVAARTYAKTIDIRRFDLVRIRNSMLRTGAVDASGTLDYQYYQALNAALSHQIFAYVTSRGFDEDDGNISVGTESNCDIRP